jgi:Fe-S-cluster containining protein
MAKNAPDFGRKAPICYAAAVASVSLPLLDAQIEQRARATHEAHPWWPCAEGCSHCCRSLPHLPEISEPEWRRLSVAIEALAPDVRDLVALRIREAEDASRPVTCPLLERTRGVCLVYEARPVACRAYGFYVDREGGLHCGKVTDAVAAHEGEGEPIVWGNGDAVERALAELGDKRSLAAWAQGSAASAISAGERADEKKRSSSMAPMK